MSKKEDMRYNMVILFVVVSLMFVVVLFPFDSITGSAVEVDNVQVKQELGSLISEFPLVKYATNADVCFVINIAENIQYSYKVSKRDTSVEITDSPLYCDGAKAEDFIIGYINYDSFKNHVSDTSCSDFKKGNTKDFYLYLSKFVKAGGDISCTTEFRDKYCASLYYCLSESEMASQGLECCLDLPESQKPTALQAARAGVNANERESSPSTRGAGSAGSFIMIAAIALIVVVVLGGGVFFVLEMKKKPDSKQEKGIAAKSGKPEMGGKKGAVPVSSKITSKITLPSLLAGIPPDQIEEVKEYIKSCDSQGFTKEQIHQALRESGWSDDKALTFMNTFHGKNL